MNNTRTISIQEMQQVLSGTAYVSFKAQDKEEMYEWIETTLRDSCYKKLKKKQRGVVRRYMQKMTGLKKAQLTKLIRQFKTKASVRVKDYQRHSFPRIYQTSDIALLAEADLALRMLNGPATAAIFRREYEVFGNAQYQNLSGISPAHIYNLRKKSLYRDQTKLFQKTKPRHVPIGERRKPDPKGKPGYIRVDTVHQGDSADGDKGLYTINLIDELTQWEIMVAVEKISEAHLVPVLEAALQQFPFPIQNFHADNGGEFVNYSVADMLQRMLVKFTRSRPRKSNDNALVESKNGSIVRKHLGHIHIPQKHAEQVNGWYQNHLNLFVNFHRPCAFGKEVIINERTGKRKRIYPYDDYQTPYDKFRSMEDASKYLRAAVTFEQLDEIAYADSDIGFAQKTERAREDLFKELKS